ncbi:MAG: chemotaxis protein CheW [Pseudobdellovibrio sp.]
MSETTVTTDNRYMEFKLGDQLYAIPLLTVKEVIPKPEVTPVPNMPLNFEGMINLRGQILGVYNVRKKLGAKTNEISSKQPPIIIIIEHSGVKVGMIVDEVTRVLHTEAAMIRPAPLKEDDPARHFIGSVIQTGGDLILTVHVDQLLELDKYDNSQKAA